MTSNMAEIFNAVLKGITWLPLAGVLPSPSTSAMSTGYHDGHLLGGPSPLVIQMVMATALTGGGLERPVIG
jgi:hypothetical protein